MATLMNRESQWRTSSQRMSQKASISVGVVLIFMGLVGISFPGFLGMHLGLVHNIVHLGAGAIALWSGFSQSPRKSYVYCLSFGAIFAIIGALGFMFGTPGYSTLGTNELDQNLLKIIPDTLEFGTVDHFFHLVLGGVLLIFSYLYGRQENLTNKPA